MKNAISLFVYGTLRKEVAHPMHRILERYGIFQGTGTVRGKLYDLGRYPGAIASDEDSDRIVGELYRLEPADRALSRLDDYEGRRFQRREFSVFLEDQTTSTAWAYLYTGPIGRCRRITCGDYVAFLNRA